jgi:hypothetical protein
MVTGTSLCIFDIATVDSQNRTELPLAAAAHIFIGSFKAQRNPMERPSDDIDSSHRSKLVT